MTKVQWFINGQRIVSQGNGTAYELTSKDGQTSAFFQGDDASQFMAEYEAAQRARRLPAFLLDTLADYGAVA